MSGPVRQLIGVLLLFFGVLGGASAQAQPAPPRWDDVVDNAALIVRARVVRGGRFAAEVQAEQVYFGQAPDGPFTVLGFNDPSFPPPIIEQESLRTGETVWLFLNRWDGLRWGIDIPVWTQEGWDPVPGQTWAPDLSIAGDVPLRDGQVAVHLLFGGYHHGAPTMTVERWESLLRAMVDRVKHDRIDQAGLARARSCLDAGPSSTGSDQGETPDVRCLAELALRGDHSADPRLLDFAQGSPMTRGVAAGLAAWGDDPRTDTLIREVAISEVPEGPLAMVQVAQGDAADRVAGLVVRLLAASRSDSAPPGTTLRRLRDEGVRTRLLAQLVDLRSAATRDPLLGELRFLNPDTLYIGIEALDRIEPGCWVDAAMKIVERAELRRTTSVLDAMEALRAEGAREGLHAFVRRTDVDPGLQRHALQVLSVIGDASTAAMLRELLQPYLVMGSSWDDDRVDAVGSLLNALEVLTGAEAADAAWVVARQYLGQPRGIVSPSLRAKLDAEREVLQTSIERALPQGSTARVRVVFERDAAFEARGERIVLVDVKATKGVTELMRGEIARLAATSPERVRLCGPDPTGRVRCIYSRTDFWQPHGRLLGPMLRAIGASAGLGPRAAEHPDPVAGRWLALAITRGWLQESDARHLVDDLWGELFWGPIHPDSMPPLLPPGTPSFDDTLPPR